MPQALAPKVTAADQTHTHITSKHAVTHTHRDILRQAIML